MTRKRGFILLVIIGSALFISREILWRDGFENSAYLDPLIFALPTFLIWWLYSHGFGRVRLLLSKFALAAVALGALSNAAVGLANNGRFPVYGASTELFDKLPKSSYYVMGSPSDSLPWLADYNVLPTDASHIAAVSIGDVVVFVGVLLWVGLHLFGVYLWWRSRRTAALVSVK